MKDVLDYILETVSYAPRWCSILVTDRVLGQNQEVKLAIASDLDLYALFKVCFIRAYSVGDVTGRVAQDQDFPDDVAAELRRLKPAVELDENNGRYSFVRSFTCTDRTFF